MQICRPLIMTTILKLVCTRLICIIDGSGWFEIHVDLKVYCRTGRSFAYLDGSNGSKPERHDNCGLMNEPIEMQMTFWQNAQLILWRWMKFGRELHFVHLPLVAIEISRKIRLLDPDMSSAWAESKVWTTSGPINSGLNGQLHATQLRVT